MEEKIDARKLPREVIEEKRRQSQRHLKMNASILIDFCQRLIKSAGRKVFFVLDNLRVYHAKIFKAWLDGLKKDIEVFYLPSYSPELNPDEYLNCDF